MKYIADMNYISATEEETTTWLLYGNAVYNAGGKKELFSDYRTDCVMLSAVTIITPTQTVTLPFDHPYSDGGHARITDVMLSKIYPNYYEIGGGVDQGIYFHNREDNIFILQVQGDEALEILLSEEITQSQYDALSKYIEEIKQSDSVKSGTLQVIFLGNQIVVIDEIDKKMQELRAKIKGKESQLREYPISEFDFSDCQNEDEIMERARQYSKILNQRISENRRISDLASRLGEQTSKEQDRKSDKDIAMKEMIKQENEKDLQLETEGTQQEE